MTRAKTARPRVPKPRARRGRPVRAWLLIKFHGTVPRSVQRLKRVEVAPGWPGGASVMRIDRVKPITRVRPARVYNAFAEIHAASRPALDRILDYVEANFSHIDVYEF